MARQVQAPKPFEYIPFAKRVVKSPPAGHHRYDPALVTGYLRGEIEVLTPLHVASGGIELTKDVMPGYEAATPLVKAFVRSNDVRVIPGSSLKGAVRSVVEAITPSTVGKVGRRTNIPQDLQEPRQLKREQRGARPLRPPVENPLSPADRMFGVMDYLGQVQFWDGAQIGDEVVLVQVPSLFQPREGGKAPGRKFYQHGRPASGNTPTEAVPAGGRFGLRCDFENLSAAELGVLLIALGQGEGKLHLKLGGGKPVCYGSVRIHVGSLRVRGDVVADYLDWAGTEETVSPVAYMEAALAEKGFVLQEQLATLAATLAYPNDRECPEGNY